MCSLWDVSHRNHLTYPRFDMRQDEHRLQVACVRWFSYEYPKLKHLLIAIPNGGKRHLTTAKKLKAEGAKAGVPDLFLAVPTQFNSGLWIEMKAEKGRLRPSQSDYLESLLNVGYDTTVCRSFDDFQKAIQDYFTLKKTNKSWRKS